MASGKVTLTLRITEELDTWLRLEAECTGRTLSQVAEEALRAYHYQREEAKAQ